MTYLEAGMGHIISAEAIANALEKYYPDEVEVIRTNILTDTGEQFLIEHEKFLIDEVKKSNQNPIHMFYLRVLKLSLFPRMTSLRIAYGTIFRREKMREIEILKGFDPDLVVSTHFEPHHIAIEANRKKYGGRFLAALYNPDPNTHGWYDNRGDLTAFNNLWAYREAMKMGFRPEASLLTRFVIREKVYATPRDKALLRGRYGLPEDDFTVTLASSAYAGGHLTAFADRLLQIDRSFTLCIIAGNNEEVYQEFKRRGGMVGKIRLFVFRFLPDAHELYGASDLFITKAGPNAILDSVYMHTPVMTNYYASIIEQVTRDYYIGEQKVGVYLPDPDQAAEFLTACIDDPRKLEPYIENCKRFSRHHIGGEKEIADALVHLMRENGPPKADGGEGPVRRRKKRGGKLPR